MSGERGVEWFLEMVGREQSRLRAFIRSLGVRAAAVDDLAQDALIVAFEKRGEFDPKIQQDFGTWVRGISRKLVANEMRKESRRKVFVSRHVSEVLLNVEPSQADPLAHAVDDRLDALTECLKQLPERSRQIVHLRYFEELSPGVIASQLERTANDVRQVLFRIRGALLTCVEKRRTELQG